MLGAKGKNTNKKPGELSKVKGEKAVLKGLKGYCGFSVSSSSSYSSTWRHHCYIINHLCLKLTVWSQTLLLWFSKITHTWFIASLNLPPLAHSPLTTGLFSTMIDFSTSFTWVGFRTYDPTIWHLGIHENRRSRKLLSFSLHLTELYFPRKWVIRISSQRDLLYLLIRMKQALSSSEKQTYREKSWWLPEFITPRWYLLCPVALPLDYLLCQTHHTGHTVTASYWWRIPY